MQPHQEWSDLGDILDPFFTTTQIKSHTMVILDAHPRTSTATALFSPLCCLSFSFQFSFLLAAIVMTPRQTQWLGS